MALCFDLSGPYNTLSLTKLKSLTRRKSPSVLEHGSTSVSILGLYGTQNGLGVKPLVQRFTSSNGLSQCVTKIERHPYAP